MSVELIETQTNDYQYWVEDDFLCTKFILNDLADNLYDYYKSDKSAKEILDASQKIDDKFVEAW